MAVSARSVSWEIPADRKAPTVRLGLILLGMFAGFGIDFAGFLRERPPAAGIVYPHAAIFVGWLVLVTPQVAFILRGRMSQHRRLGSKAGYLALLMIPVGFATGLTAAAQGHEPRSTLRCTWSTCWASSPSLGSVCCTAAIPQHTSA